MSNWNSGVLPGDSKRAVFSKDCPTNDFGPAGLLVRLSGNINVAAIEFPVKGRLVLADKTKIQLAGVTAATTDSTWRCKTPDEQEFMCAANWQVVTGTKRTQAVRPPCVNDDATFSADSAFAVHIPSKTYVSQVFVGTTAISQGADWDKVASNRADEVRLPVLDVRGLLSWCAYSMHACLLCYLRRSWSCFIGQLPARAPPPRFPTAISSTKVRTKLHQCGCCHS